MYATPLNPEKPLRVGHIVEYVSDSIEFWNNRINDGVEGVVLDVKRNVKSTAAIAWERGPGCESRDKYYELVRNQALVLRFDADAFIMKRRNTIRFNALMDLGGLSHE